MYQQDDTGGRRVMKAIRGCQLKVVGWDEGCVKCDVTDDDDWGDDD
jgi:hypothetical protein